MKIILDLEFSPAAIYTLYASLRHFKEMKAKTNTEDSFSMCASEAEEMLCQIADQYPSKVKECIAEYEENY